MTSVFNLEFWTTVMADHTISIDSDCWFFCIVLIGSVFCAVVRLEMGGGIGNSASVVEFMVRYGVGPELVHVRIGLQLHPDCSSSKMSHAEWLTVVVESSRPRNPGSDPLLRRLLARSGRKCERVNHLRLLDLCYPG
ncbi:hypothetical protein M758_1G135400 [Ceratodon purpureus]|nr:hypothetical protein M758_1G135400 [Ceratodon purpureus]